MEFGFDAGGDRMSWRRRDVGVGDVAIFEAVVAVGFVGAHRQVLGVEGVGGNTQPLVQVLHHRYGFAHQMLEYHEK